jgi:pyrroline-5-carboxylate reductase
MPNLALNCGESAIGLTTEDSFSKLELNEINSLCEYLGKSYWIPESKFNAFTSLGGSGTAFIFALIESMVEAGISMGFSAAEAQDIVQQTIKGSLALLDNTQKHPAELKWQVTSPGGTTIAGLRKFEEFGVRAGVMNTFLAAYQHAKDLS